MTEFSLPSKAIAACIGLLGCSVSIICGMLSGGPADEILLRSMLAMGACIVLGRAIMWATRLCLEERLAQHVEATPIPDSSGVSLKSGDLIKHLRSDRANSAG
jgi:undecaprenyl pyrophosphate phosphatase UppP